MSWVFKNFEPTRSGFGDAKAWRPGLPLIRTWLQSLHLGSQAQFRTFPIFQGDGGNAVLRFQIGQVVLPTRTISWTSFPCRLLRWAASFLSAEACWRLMA